MWCLERERFDLDFWVILQMEFSFGTQKWTPREELESSPSSDDPFGSSVGKLETDLDNFALGLHAPKRFDKILPINECLLQDQVGNQVRDTPMLARAGTGVLEIMHRDVS